MSNASLNLSGFAGLGRNLSQDNGPANGQTRQREDAKFWLNIGYQASVTNEQQEEEPVFVSLARGIPIDQIELFDVTKQRTPNMAVLRQAQNDLHGMFMTEANKLEPGQSKLLIIDETTGLAVELKRVKGPQEIPTENALSRQIKFRD